MTLDKAATLTDGDNVPVLVSFEFRECEAVRYFERVSVLSRKCCRADC